MSRVVLISDNSSFGLVGSQRYIGPYSIAHALDKNNVETVIIDYFSRKDNFFDYLKKFITKDTLFVGLSTTFLSPPYSIKMWAGANALTESTENYSNCSLMFKTKLELKDWIAQLKNAITEANPKTKLILGGAKVQFLLRYEKSFLDEVDYFIWGSVDSVISDITSELAEKGEVRHKLINDHKVVDTLDTFKPSKNCTSFQWNRNWSIVKNEALPIEISRGCSFNCKYCHYEKKESRRKDIADLRNEIIYNYENFGTTFYHFCDDCFNDNKEKVENVCKMILELPFKIEWISYARVDIAIRYPHTMELMIRSGCRAIHWGIETLNDKISRQIGKGVPSDSVKKFLTDTYKNFSDICLQHGSFITGLPGETIESQMNTIKWFVDNEALHFITVGPLKLFDYKNEFDGQAMDFSDYSKNPEKYGFKKVSFSPSDWEHETMNREKAFELSSVFNSTWRSSNSRRRGTINTMWNYPHLRSLGYSLEETREIYFNVKKSGHYAKELNARFGERLDNYFKQNEALNG